MCHPSKLTQLLLLALIVLLVACSPAATPLPPASTNPPPTNTISPTDTPAPPPTSALEPTPTVPPKPTATRNPKFFEGKFDAGGVNLYITCYGVGSPTVVLDAGWGVDSSGWFKIIPKIMPHTRVCAYDRASMGQSDNQTGLRTSTQMAEQLHALLKSAEVEGPYLVVGHSLGGMNMLVYADRYRDEVASVVLVDSAHPDQNEQWLAVLPTPAPDEPTDLTDLRTDLEQGWTNPEDPSFPEPMDWETTLAQVRAVKSLGNLPLTVLVAVDPARRSWGNIPDDLKARLDKVKLDLHTEYLNLSTDSSLIRAERSGHFIQNDEPKLVIDAILKLIDKVRQK